MIVFYRVILIISILLFVFSFGFGWISFPMIFKRLIRKKMTLMPETQTRGMWQAFPFPFEFSIHVFNVTNPSEVQNGAKPIVQDVGPFVFDEFKDKFNFEDNENDDTVSFNMRNTFLFQPTRSNGLTGEELITMPHPIVQMLAISLKHQSLDMLKVIAEGLSQIFRNEGPFITAPFMDLFFRGFFIDCSSEHYAVRAVCGLFEAGSIRGAKVFNATHFKFSLMGESNHTDAGRFKVLRGRRRSKDLGKVLEVNGQAELDVWSGSECNRLKGTDGTIFPPFLDPHHGLWSYSPDLCRSMSPKLSRGVQYAGLPAVRFVMDFGDIKNEKENTCFCTSYPDVCPVKGTMDLSPCTKTPMTASMPHFLHGDETLFENIIGLHPSDSQHGTHIDFETVSGTPLSVYKRVQFNLNVEPVAEVAGMENLRSLIMPMFWVDESLNLIPAVTNELKKIFKMLLINDVVKWSTLVTSIIGFACTIYIHNLRKQQGMIEPST